ncbi:hypothetical protein ACSQ67_003830 [Phaseolus vulgaris]
MVVEVENQVVGLHKGSDAGFIQPGASPKGSSYMAKNDKRVKKSDELGQGNFFLFMSMHGKFLNIAKVYSANDYTARRSLWKTLSNLQDSWCILGDFNTVLASDESKGGSIPNQIP